METSGKKVIELNIEDVLPNRFQPRIKFNDEAINELSKSIKEHGVIQPIVVRPIGDKFEIIAGERRYKASRMAELKTIPALITDLNDKDSAEVALIENVQRENLTPIEEAISYKKILDMGYTTQEALAAKLGKTQSTVANKLRLLNLDDEVQEALLNEKISERHARSLLKLQNKEQQRQLLNKIISERLTVRRADEEIEKLLKGENIELPKQGKNYEHSIEKQEQMQSVEPPKFEQNDELPKQEEPEIFKFINIPQPEENKSESTEEIKVDNQEEQESELKPGKFFNILSNEEEKEPEEQNNTFENIFINPTTEPNHSLIEELNEIEKIINNSNKIENISHENGPEKKEDDDLEFIEDDDFEFEDEKINSQEQSKEIKDQQVQEQPEKIVDNKIELEPKINEFKDVLQLIRNCSEKIEESGFIIDTEEYDLEGEYQVVFKINKKDK